MKTKLSVTIVLLIVTGCIARPAQPTERGVSGFESPLYTYHYWMPFVVAEKAPTPTPTPTCFKSAAAEQFYLLMRYDARQQRKAITCDPRLVAAAELRAKAQPSDGLAHCDQWNVCANSYVRAQGCRLPSDYGLGNQVESLSAGTPNAQAAFDSLARSPAHKVHLFGENDTFRRQDRVGIAMVEVPGHRYRFVWAVLISECVSMAN
jgi:hypothetical protein